MNWGFLAWPLAFFVGMKFMFWVCVVTYWGLLLWIGDGTLDWLFEKDSSCLLYTSDAADES